MPGQTRLDGQKIPAPTLAFKIPANPHTIFLGLGPGPNSADVGHYYPGATTQFWNFFHECGLWPDAITAEQDDQILSDGFGLADVSRRATKGAVHTTKAAYFAARSIVGDMVRKYKPKLLAFVGKEAYAVFTRRATAKISYGPQPAYLGVEVFVLPTPSNRYQMMSRKDKLVYYRDFAGRVKALRSG